MQERRFVELFQHAALFFEAWSAAPSALGDREALSYFSGVFLSGFFSAKVSADPEELKRRQKSTAAPEEILQTGRRIEQDSGSFPIRNFQLTFEILSSPDLNFKILRAF